MSKFNSKSEARRIRTMNQAGGEAFVESSKLEFASLLLTSFVEDQFYRSKHESLSELASLLDKLPDKKFAAKAHKGQKRRNSNLG